MWASYRPPVRSGASAYDVPSSASPLAGITDPSHDWVVLGGGSRLASSTGGSSQTTSWPFSPEGTFESSPLAYGR